MDKEGEETQIEDRGSLFPLRPPQCQEFPQKEEVHVAPEEEPRGVKQDRNQFNPDGEELRADSLLRGSLMLLENDPPRNQEPRVDLHAQARPHEPAIPRKAVGRDQVEQSGEVVLDDDARRFDALGHEQDPDEIGQKVLSRSKQGLLLSNGILQVEEILTSARVHGAEESGATWATHPDRDGEEQREPVAVVQPRVL